MEKIDYQVEISKVLDKAFIELDTEDFDTLIQSIKEVIEDYN